MVIPKKDNIVSIKQWKIRASLVHGAIRQGWNVTPNDLVDINRPTTFYICEPLQTGFTAFSVFDRSGFENLVKTGTKKYGRPREIFESVASVTMDLIAEGLNRENKELMEAVLSGNLINYAGTQTALEIYQDKSYCHLGSIIYNNPLRKDGVVVSFRPIALSNAEATLDKEKLFLAVSNYVLNDQAKHPEYFEGIDVAECLAGFAKRLGVDFDKLLQV